MKRLAELFEYLTRPRILATICGFALLVTLVFDGSLFVIYKMNRRLSQLNSDISKIDRETARLEKKYESAKHPRSLARQAQNRFDMVGKDDLIFVFTD